MLNFRLRKTPTDIITKGGVCGSTQQPKNRVLRKLHAFIIIINMTSISLFMIFFKEWIDFYLKFSNSFFSHNFYRKRKNFSLKLSSLFVVHSYNIMMVIFHNDIHQKSWKKPKLKKGKILVISIFLVMAF